MLLGLCMCGLFPSPPIQTRTHLTVYAHHIDFRKPTNTGRLAALCLANAEVVVRGHGSEPTPAFSPRPDSIPLLLFPHPDATPLTEVPRGDAPVTAPPKPIGSSQYHVQRVSLTPGSNGGAHVLESSAPVGIQVLGYGQYTSYQYPGGLNLDEIAPPPPPPM